VAELLGYGRRGLSTTICAATLLLDASGQPGPGGETSSTEASA